LSVAESVEYLRRLRRQVEELRPEKKIRAGDPERLVRSSTVTARLAQRARIAQLAAHGSSNTDIGFCRASGGQLYLGVGRVVQWEVELSDRDLHGGLAECDRADVQRPIERCTTSPGCTSRAVTWQIGWVVAAGDRAAVRLAAAASWSIGSGRDSCECSEPPSATVETPMTSCMAASSDACPRSTFTETTKQRM